MHGSKCLTNVCVTVLPRKFFSGIQLTTEKNFTLVSHTLCHCKLNCGANGYCFSSDKNLRLVGNCCRPAAGPSRHQRNPSSSECDCTFNTIKKLLEIEKEIGDCAWSCSRWQTQPEKICKSQCTNQCHFTPHIVLICALRFADFLRLCLSPRTTSRTISNLLFYFQ